MGKILLLILLGLVGTTSLIVLYSTRRWTAGTRMLHARLEAARTRVTPTTYDARELSSLPAPVQRYFRAVLTEGQPMVAAVRLEHTGTFDMSDAAAQWKPFTSIQHVTTRRPGFVWDARIAMMPGLSVRVHDTYVAGEGILHATVGGLVSVADVRGTRDVAQGELMRFLAEAPWYPTALLPSQGVRWETVDEASAKATLADADLSVTLLFRFNEAGLIESVYADARGRTVHGVVMPTPWEGRWQDYQWREGMRVPLEGEVAWLLPDGEKPYWRGRVAVIAYEFAR